MLNIKKEEMVIKKVVYREKYRDDSGIKMLQSVGIKVNQCTQ